jgi:uncharacterized protein YfaS (alpha-2-macroglobulin family)
VLVVKGETKLTCLNLRMGIAEIQVDTRANAQCGGHSDRESAGPGEQVQYTVRTRDSNGKPVSAELSLGLSDLATLSLLPPNSPPILDYFYSRRNLGVLTSVPIVLSLDEYNANIQEDIVQGAARQRWWQRRRRAGRRRSRQDFDTAFWKRRL